MSLMVLLVFIVGLIAVKARFSNVKKGKVNGKYFKLMEGGDIPEIIIKTTRNFNNQFEIPVLFYVVCTLYISLGLENSFSLIFAWLFVVFRYFHSYIHSYIHLTYNHILHRSFVYWGAFICVMVLWVNLIANKL